MSRSVLPGRGVTLVCATLVGRPRESTVSCGRAVAAAQVGVVGRLHPGLPDPVSGTVAIPLHRLQLRSADLADVAEKVRAE